MLDAITQPIPTVRMAAPPQPRSRKSLWQWVALTVVAVVALLIFTTADGLPLPGQLTLVVFLAAAVLWIGGRMDETLVAVGAALVVVAVGAAESDALFSSLGDDMIWLLIAAFVLAAGVTATGLTTRFAVWLVLRARSVRQLAHLLTAALLMSALAVPSTSGRAALAVPVFAALAGVLGARQRVVKALAVLFPTVILLTAIATMVGAGAHMVTNEILAATTGQQIGFAHWLLLGLPLAALSAHCAAELVLWLFTEPVDRRAPLRIRAHDLAACSDIPVSGRLTAAEMRAIAVVVAVIVGWCTEGLHGAHPALVALAAAIVITSPRIGTTTMSAGLKTVPWSLLIFMACTATLGSALASSGAAEWLAGAVFGVIETAPGGVFVVGTIAVSAAAHLLLQSRTARSSVLVPLVIPVAAAVGLNPVAVAFASTAAAGFCHTLTTSAKPVAMFAALDGVPTYRGSDLLRLSAGLGPLTATLVLACALFLWPHLGLPLY